jgi:predicted nucleotidyltransferase
LNHSDAQFVACGKLHAVPAVCQSENLFIAQRSADLVPYGEIYAAPAKVLGQLKHHGLRVACGIFTVAAAAREQLMENIVDFH